jgi:hypothetical protein
LAKTGLSLPTGLRLNIDFCASLRHIPTIAIFVLALLLYFDPLLILHSDEVAVHVEMEYSAKTAWHCYASRGYELGPVDLQAASSACGQSHRLNS